MRFYRYFLPVMLWMAVIFVASTQIGSAAATSGRLAAALHWLVAAVGHPLTAEQTWRLIFLLRKLGHVTEYAVLALLAMRAIRQEDPGWNWRAAGAAAALAILYAATDEWHQSFEPSRTAAVGDVLIDAAGVTLALGVAWLCHLGRRLTTGGRRAAVGARLG